MNLFRRLLNRLEGSSATAVERYEVSDEPDVPAWRSRVDGRQLYLRPQLVEATFWQYGKGPWRFRELALVGDIVGTGLHNARVTYRRRRDVPAWAVEALAAPDWTIDRVPPAAVESGDR